MDKFLMILILLICFGFWGYTYFKVNQMSAHPVEGFENIEFFANNDKDNDQDNQKGGFNIPNVDIKKHYKNLLNRIMPKGDEADSGDSEPSPDQDDTSVDGSDGPAPTQFSEGKHGNLTRCKFFASHSEGYSCPSSHPHHSGAVISSKGNSGMKCNGEKLHSNRAKAHAEVRNGGVHKIHVTHNGSNYVGRPKVIIKGNGKNAKGRAMMGNDGTVSSIKMLHTGSGYTNSPTVIIGEPDGYHHCHMCCATNESDKSTLNN